jgi:hypothetical protein
MLMQVMRGKDCAYCGGNANTAPAKRELLDSAISQ